MKLDQFYATTATKECPPFNCDHVKCPVGLERDEDGCVMNNCQCKDLCKVWCELNLIITKWHHSLLCLVNSK